MSFNNRGSAARYRGPDVLGAPIEMDQGLLDQYINSAEGQRVGAHKLKGARVYKAGDRPGYSPDEGITDLYAGYYNWAKEEEKRLKQHEEYVALSQEQPGRKATILGGDGGFKSILGGGVM